MLMDNYFPLQEMRVSLDLNSHEKYESLYEKLGIDPSSQMELYYFHLALILLPPTVGGPQPRVFTSLNGRIFIAEVSVQKLLKRGPTGTLHRSITFSTALVEETDPEVGFTAQGAQTAVTEMLLSCAASYAAARAGTIPERVVRSVFRVVGRSIRRKIAPAQARRQVQKLLEFVGKR